MPWCLIPTVYECNIQCDSSLLILSLLYILIKQRSEVLNSPSQKLTKVPMILKKQRKWNSGLMKMFGI